MSKQFRITCNQSGTLNARQFVRLVAALGLFVGVGLFVPAQTTFAAFDDGSTREALVNPQANLPGRPRAARQGHASKEALHGSAYAAIRRHHGTVAASSGQFRSFFR
jgi:hypothetical protein